MEQEITPTAPAAETVDIAAERASWQAAEQSRLDSLKAVFAPHGDAYRTLYDDCRSDMSVDAASASTKLLAAIAEGNKPLGSARIESGVTDSQKFLKGAEAALLERSSLDLGDKPDMMS